MGTRALEHEQKEYRILLFLCRHIRTHEYLLAAEVR